MTRPWSVVILTAMFLGLHASASGVGPYFENERRAGDQIPIPEPKTLIPGPNLVPQRQALVPAPPEITRLVKGQLLDMDKYIYVVKEESGDAQVAIKITPDTRLVSVPQVGDRIEAQVRSNGDAWSVRPIP